MPIWNPVSEYNPRSIFLDNNIWHCILIFLRSWASIRVRRKQWRAKELSYSVSTKCTILLTFVPFHSVPFRNIDYSQKSEFREMITFYCLITKIVSTLFRETRSEQNSVGNHNCTRAKDANKSYRKLMVQIFQISNVNFLRYTTSVAQSQDSLKKWWQNTYSTLNATGKL
jgi:hypothetical protein